MSDVNMYDLLLFTGGVYKFDEFKEFIDDVGGLIIEMESFKVNRGMYFLSEEMKVLLIVPEEEKEIIKSFAKEIKGSIEPVLMENKEIEKVVLIFEIYKKLQIDELLNMEEINKHLLNKPDFINLKDCNLENICNEEGFLEKINELLILMEEMSIIKSFEKNELIHYKINKQNNKSEK
ncbi:hypothetical protein KQY27_08010 [Methanobrevibacter sp. TMH8]|uniref:methyl-coenzyme M reductase family protein n=1 Tax=Methanobrevibacter sp. TMH8 TaxID=2848611 RepID=UPI001CCC3333|nr:methyl-coenzyme M reductase family protein [Methanobrevibacter sp. TMH8]MBZ9571490.1 hypothetical protein [Methanobrevibacter sp. TMH8]